MPFIPINIMENNWCELSTHPVIYPSIIPGVYQFPNQLHILVENKHTGCNSHVCSDMADNQPDRHFELKFCGCISLTYISLLNMNPRMKNIFRYQHLCQHQKYEPPPLQHFPWINLYNSASGELCTPTLRAYTLALESYSLTSCWCIITPHCATCAGW